MLGAETQDLGIRDLPDAHAQLIEMQLLLEEVSSNVEVLQEKVRSRPCCSQQCLIWYRLDSATDHAVLTRSHPYDLTLRYAQLRMTPVSCVQEQADIVIQIRLRYWCSCASRRLSSRGQQLSGGKHAS